MVKFETLGIAASGGLMILTALTMAIGSISETGQPANTAYQQVEPARVETGLLKPNYALLVDADRKDELG